MVSLRDYRWRLCMSKAKTEWEPITDCDIGLKELLGANPMTSAPLKMRRMGSDGRWIFRDPTPEEIQDWLESEAW
jgi:hypothetical protein